MTKEPKCALQDSPKNVNWVNREHKYNCEMKAEPRIEALVTFGDPGLESPNTSFNSFLNTIVLLCGKTW